jgi:flavin reductase (DIM6/NTAB) family NADH-FMN oxidoreductase RutF
MTDAITTLVSRADPPLYVVTTAVGADRAGCVVGFATQASIDPVRFLVAISTANRTWRVARSATHLAVHLFGRERLDLITLFGGETGDDLDKFAQCAWSLGPAGMPVLDRATAWFVGIILERFHFGDHVGHLLEPIGGDVGTPVGEDVVTLRDGDTLEPGHPA